MKSRKKFRLISTSPTLIALLILIGAGVMGWMQASALSAGSMIAGAWFLDAVLVANLFATLRSAQTKSIIQGIVQAGITIITGLSLWKVGSYMGAFAPMYYLVVLGAIGSGGQLIATLTGANADLDDGWLDEKQARGSFFGKKKPTYRAEPESEFANYQ